MKHFDMPPVWMIGSLILVWVLNQLVPIFDFGRFLGRWIPLMLSLVGLAYIGFAALKFRMHQTSIHPGQTPTTLITDGIFKVSRNPIYTGYALIILAFVIHQGGITGVIGLGLFVWVTSKRFIAEEEAVVLANFPEAKEWFENTNRW